MSRRDEILGLTNDLIQDRGYKGFSYADLSKALGITKASIHHHFASKEDLGVAYCETKIAALTGFRAEITKLKTGAEKFQAYLNVFKGCANGKMCGINAMQSDIGDMSDTLIAKVRQVSELELEILTEILTTGRANKEFAFNIPPYEQAIMISAALKGALLLDRIKKDNSFDRICNSIRTSIEPNNNRD